MRYGGANPTICFRPELDRGNSVRQSGIYTCRSCKPHGYLIQNPAVRSIIQKAATLPMAYAGTLR